MNHTTTTVFCLFALTPTLAWAQGAEELMLGDPEAFEERLVEGVLEADASGRPILVEGGGARFALPDTAGALIGRPVKVSGVVGERAPSGARTLERLTWLEPTPHSATGYVITEDAPILRVGEARYELLPPRELSSSALSMLSGRSGVEVTGYLYPTGELVVSGVMARIGELAEGDEAWLSQRTPDGEPGRYRFENALDAQGQRERLPNGAPVKISDIELYRIADREAGESVGRFREIPAGFQLEHLAADERVFVYVERLDRNRTPGDPRSEGWLPLRKVEAGKPLADRLNELAAIADAQPEAGVVEALEPLGSEED